jgi:pimeloyl-ACP methyl ester carboxylesterase
MTDFFAAPDGTRLAFRDEGRGVPVLCLSGLTRTMGDFDYLAPHVPPCRLIRMDYRGRGASAWTGADSYTVPCKRTMPWPCWTIWGLSRPQSSALRAAG